MQAQERHRHIGNGRTSNSAGSRAKACRVVRCGPVGDVGLSLSPIVLLEPADDLWIVVADVGVLDPIRLAVLEHVLQSFRLLGRVDYHVLVERFRRHAFTVTIQSSDVQIYFV